MPHIAPRKRTRGRKRTGATTARDAFRHVVLLLLENRSFDHILGALQEPVPDLDGVPPTGPRRSNADAAGRVFEQLPAATRIVDPDPKHEMPNVRYQIAAANGRFVKDYARAYPDASDPQKQEIMAYHRLGSLPALHGLGQVFAIYDRWFCSVPGPTWTNRLFAMSGTSLGRVKMPEGLFHPNLHRYEQPSVFRRLDEAGRSTRIYFGDFPLALLLADRRGPRAARGFSRLPRFFEDAAGAEEDFPEFAFIEPHYLREPDDDHPPHDILGGERLVADVYAALRANAPLWESTLLVVAYDEHGGFYDHVSPHAAPPPDGHREEYTFDSFGVRVPALLVSPWIEPQVVHTPWDHTVLLAYLRRSWGLGAMGRRVDAAPDLLEGVRLTKTPRPDTPRRLMPVSKRVPVTARRAAERAALTDHQRAIVAFSTYLDTLTPEPPARKVRAAAKVMRSPGDARRVAEDRATRFLRHRGARV